MRKRINKTRVKKSRITDLDIYSLKDTSRERAEQETRHEFKKIDADKSGYIDIRELQQGLKKYGIKLSERQTQKLMQQYDDDPDNKIEIREFIQLKRDIEADNFRRNRSTRRNKKRHPKKSSHRNK